jgi:uncharacterized protein (TIGR03086 family)
LPTIDLRPASEHLSALIKAVPDNMLVGPTPCSNYCVGDLLDHIAGLTVAFGGAAVKASGESASMGPSGDGTNLDPDWRVSLPQRLESLVQAWAHLDAWTGTTRVGGQDLPGEIAGIILFGELTIHGWDLERATDLPFEPDLAGLLPLFDLVRQTFGPGQDAARGSAFGPAVPVAEGAPMLDQTLGLLGRDPTWTRSQKKPALIPES